MSLRLFLLGATGKTGSQIVDLALYRGHRVTAFARSPEKLDRRNDALACIQGDPLSSEQLARALPGHDAVLSALGLPARQALRPSTLMTRFAASTAAAMQTAGVSRIAIVSAAVLFAEPGLRFAFFRWLLRHHARDLSEMETVIRATPFAWTIARPPRLVASADTRYRSTPDRLPENGWSISFRAVAAFLLDSVEQGSHSRSIVGLAGHDA